MQNEFVLNAPPSDGISSLTFSTSTSNDLLVTSWDSTLRLYDTISNSPKSTHNFNGAILTGCFNADGSTAFAGGLDKSVYMIDLARGMKTVINEHHEAISCVAFNSQINAL
jgi:cell cycle arrest protein BUB3